jgi:hypothetical protein
MSCDSLRCAAARSPLGEHVAIAEPAHLGIAKHDERQIDHASVERDRPVVVGGVAEEAELLDHRRGVVDDEPPHVEEPEPEIDGVPLVVAGYVRALALRPAHVVVRDLRELGHVERPLVGQVEVRLGAAFGLGIDGEHPLVMREPPLPVPGPDPAPPHVDVVRLGLPDVPPVRPVEEHREVRIGSEARRPISR